MTPELVYLVWSVALTVLLVLIATLAGLELFGLNGFIVGPVIAALFLAVWKIVGEQRGTEISLAPR